MKKKIIWIIVLVIVIIIIGFVVNRGTDESDEGLIKVGAILPLTGPAASIAEDLVRTLDVYESDFAQNIDIVVQDDKCSGKDAVSAYNMLKNQGIRVYFVACSGSVLALAPLMAEDGNVILTGYSGSILIRDTGDEVIRFISDGLNFAERMAEVMKENPDKKYALFHEQQDYPQSLGDKLMNDAGDQIVLRETYTADSLTFKTSILKIRESDADELIYIPVSEDATKIIVKEMKDFGLDMRLLGEANLCDNTSEGIITGYSGTCFRAIMETEGYDEYIALFKEKYDKEPFYPYYNAVSFDVIYIIDQFLDGVNIVDDTVIANLKASVLDGVDGKIGSYQFESNGQVLGGDEIKRIDF